MIKNVSLVIPCYNEEENLVACIDSIQMAAWQAEVGYEIIVADNNSTDNTANRAKGLGAKVVFEKEKGVTRARQAGFEATQYDVVAFIDCDNQLPRDWLIYAIKALDKLNVVAVSGPVVYHELRLSKRIVSACFYTIAKVFHLFFPMVQGGNFILRKSALEAAGGFNTSLDFYGEDTDTAKRLSKIGKVKFDLDLWCYSSARRMEAEGFAKVGLRYVINYLSIWLRGKPWTDGYVDHRPE